MKRKAKKIKTKRQSKLEAEIASLRERIEKLEQRQPVVINVPPQQPIPFVPTPWDWTPKAFY